MASTQGGAGTHLGAATALVGVATRRPALLPAFPVLDSIARRALSVRIAA